MHVEVDDSRAVAVVLARMAVLREALVAYFSDRTAADLAEPGVREAAGDAVRSGAVRGRAAAAAATRADREADAAAILATLDRAAAALGIDVHVAWPAAIAATRGIADSLTLSRCRLFPSLAAAREWTSAFIVE